MSKMWEEIGEIVPGEYIPPKCPRCGANDMHLGNTNFVWCATCGYSDEEDEEVIPCPRCGSGKFFESPHDGLEKASCPDCGYFEDPDYD